MFKVSKLTSQQLTWGIVILLVLAIFSGYQIGLYVQKDNYADFLRSFKNIRENSDKYKFINPLIGGISPPATDVGIYSDIKDQIVSYLGEEEKKGNLYDYSFYFRDFGTGLWFGVNESFDFFPASLFKLPIAIAIYKQGEDNPTFLQKKTVYTQELSKINTSMQGNSQTSLVVGKTYTIEELVEIMIIKSDNGAKDLLLTNIDKEYLNQLFSVVSLVDPRSVKIYTISSRKYAHFIRILYGSSYLNEEHSEFLLKLLSQSTFKDGLVAGLPENISVAHKFGTYEFNENIGGKEVSVQLLHDCGVVYHPEKPYVFCFMTKGKDLSTLYRIISSVSKMIYENQEKDEGND